MTGSFRTEKFSTFPDVFFLETVEKMSMLIILFILMPDNNHQDHPILVYSQVTGIYLCPRPNVSNRLTELGFNDTSILVGYFV